MLEHEGAGHTGRFAIVNDQVTVADEIVVGRALVVDRATIAGISDEGALGQDIERVDAGVRYETVVRPRVQRLRQQ